jgi:hypothetical protein
MHFRKIIKRTFRTDYQEIVKNAREVIRDEKEYKNLAKKWLRKYRSDKAFSKARSLNKL